MTSSVSKRKDEQWFSPKSAPPKVSRMVRPPFPSNSQESIEYENHVQYELVSQATQAATQPPMATPEEIIEQVTSPPRLPSVWGILTPIGEFARLPKDKEAECIETYSAISLAGSGVFNIGRSSSSQLLINEMTISSKHCSLVLDENNGSVCIIDHKSSNGTFVNHEKLEPERKFYLAHGDCISLVSHGPGFVPTPSTSTPTAKKQRVSSRQGFAMMFQTIPNPTNFAEDYVKRVPQEIASKFGLFQELGRGNFATVYKAVSRSNGELVAVKVIEKSRFLNISPSRWGQQIKEAEVLQKLEHPYIVSFRALLRTEDAIYLVTELLTGGELYDRLISKGAYPEQKAKILTKRIVEAVAYLHEKGIAHRDLKPENIVLKSQEDDLDVKLVDFGVATEMLGGGNKTFCGSMSYVAPEVLKRRGSLTKQGTYGKAVDMWSLGVIVHVLLTLRPPFDEDEASQLHSSLSQVLKFNMPEWSRLSAAAKNFVAGCLEEKEEARLTASQALAHEWLANI